MNHQVHPSNPKIAIEHSPFEVVLFLVEYPFQVPPSHVSSVWLQISQLSILDSSLAAVLCLTIVITTIYSTVVVSNFPIDTSIDIGFSIAMFDYWKVAIAVTNQLSYLGGPTL